MYDAITKARASLVISEPFYATLVLGMPLIASEEIPTAATDGSCIMYNPEFIEGIPHAERIGVLVHEVLHVVMLHPFRVGTRDRKIWNEAADHVINILIIDGGFTLPEGCLHDPDKYRDMSTEQVYRLLTKNAKKKPKDGGEGEGDPMQGDVMPTTGNVAEQKGKEAKARVLVGKATAVGKQAGKLPSSIAKQMGIHNAPPNDWAGHLRRFMTEPCKDNQTWARGQRRFLHQGLYLPATHSLGLGKVAVILDTSGSVYADAPRFLSEVQSIGADAHPKAITLIQVDSEVQHVAEYGAGETLLRDVQGGGGTDLRTGFDYIDDKGVDPVLCIVLTDMYTPFPREAPSYPVMWVSTSPNEEAPFGETIYMEAS